MKTAKEITNELYASGFIAEENIPKVCAVIKMYLAKIKGGITMKTAEEKADSLAFDLNNAMTTQRNSLGQILKGQRELKQLSLRQVELLTKISNAYLSQLENDKIKNPSVNILYKLAEFYKIEFNALLEMAGIVKRKKGSTEKEKTLASFALSSENLNEKEEEELLKYLKFLRFQSHGK